MTRLLMLVEGYTEEIFVKRTLAAHLARYGVYVKPIVLWTKRLPGGSGYRGGVSNWKQIRENLLNLMRDGDAWVSTLLDFYGLPEDFPGLQESSDVGDPQAKVAALQSRFAAELNHQRFIPFLVLHEFEALLFSAPDTVGAHFDKANLADRLRNAVQEAGEPERINHGAATHPKARLHDLVEGYKETSDGPTLLEKIGLPAVRAACPHFDGWLTRLEALGDEAPQLSTGGA
ncbi:MAG: DUF4276 family protein [Azoarcus sp.]|jgi:hypothetical protein|nr:DUF4276 family protein [Azoarcus sp.]